MDSKIAILAFAALFMFFGCIGMDEVAGNYAEPDYGYATKGVAAAPAPMVAEEAYYGGADSYDYESDQMVIKEGSLSVNVETGTLEEKKDELTAIIDDYNAELSYIRFNEYNTEKRYALTVKIAPTKFDSFMEEVSALGEVKSIDSSVEDVTEEYIDIQTRIENLEEELDRLNALYDEADNVEEILMIEKEVTRVQTSLEIYQRQALDLERRSAQSTITIYLIEEKPALETDLIMPLEEILNLFFGALSFAIMLLVGLAGFLIPIVLVFLVLRAIYRAISKKKKK
ncbi:DUF4349 domain-containing protein [Candidatus Micrarchaeota archaeon]|nr:DUF4349 domain-containing protein [Candidatus Micrarchaeota archaeon]MBD3417606.1 DUF4349 domain-containing protein [Candidatus Micrarchaeota archaeon]